MADLNQQLNKKLYRAFCPDSLELGEYSAGNLKPARFQEIRAHLEQCPHCSHELAVLMEFLASTADDLPGKETRAAHPLSVWIARLISSSPFSSAPTPVLGLRGEESKVSHYQAGSVDLSLEVQDDLEQAGHFSIIGLISGVPAGDVRVYLWQEGRLVLETSMDELGNISFSGLESGIYNLILVTESMEIHVENVAV